MQDGPPLGLEKYYTNNNNYAYFIYFEEGKMIYKFKLDKMEVMII